MDDDLMEELAKDGEKVASTNLADVAALARKQLELEAVVAKKEQELKEAKSDLRKIQEGDLPAALKAAGIPTFQLDNGMTVSYKEDLSVSVPKARKDAVISRMKEWGYEANVSNLLTIDLGKGNSNALNVLKTQAEEMGVTATHQEDIPTGTVKKALKTRMDEGKNDDLAFFGAFSLTKATVK